MDDILEGLKDFAGFILACWLFIILLALATLPVWLGLAWILRG